MSPIEKKVVGLVMVILVAGNAYFAISFFALQKELNRTNYVVLEDSRNEKALSYMQMFISDVLKSDTEVDFETRLKLENAVREIDDQMVLESWQDFINSSDEVVAQNNVKNLLDVLTSKIAGK